MYWLLISHATAIIPTVLLFRKFWQDRNYQACFTGLNIFATASFSILYHLYDYDTIENSFGTYNLWSIMDWWASPSTIITTVLYSGKWRTEIFYSINYLCQACFLICVISKTQFLDIIVVLSSTALSLCRFKILWQYIKNFPKTLWFGILFLISAIFCYIKARDKDTYETWHSLWHLFIFSSATVFCQLRRNLDRLLIGRDVSYNRAAADSI